MIALLLFACACRTPPGSATDTALSVDSGRPDSGDAALADADCNGLDDDGNGTIDDGAAANWWLDLTRWQEVDTFASAEAQRFVGAIAAGESDTYVLVQEMAGDFTSAAISVRRVEGGEVVEVGRIESGTRIPFAYTATVDADGVLWIGGGWYTASAGTRALLAFRFDGELHAVSESSTSDGVRLYAAASTEAGVWFGGYADTAEAPDAWTLWLASSAGVDLADVSTRGGAGRIKGLLPLDGELLAAGWQDDAGGASAGVLRIGGGEATFAGLREEPDLRFVGVAPAPSNSYWLAATDGAGVGWSLRDEALAEVDAGEGTVSHVAAGPAYVWTAGTVAEGSATDVVVRGGSSAGFGLSFAGAVEEGWTSEAHDLVVTPFGEVWLSVTERHLTGAEPVRARLFRLSCR